MIGSMRYRLTDIPAMLATPAGRLQVTDGVAYRAWPLMSRLARLYRRTIARRQRVVAVVGSFGKSTTMRAVALVMGVAGPGGSDSPSWGSCDAVAIAANAPRPPAVSRSRSWRAPGRW